MEFTSLCVDIAVCEQYSAQQCSGLLLLGGEMGEMGVMERVIQESNATIHTWAKNGDTQAVKLLLNCGIDVNLKDRDDTALHIAAENGFTHVAQLLLDRGADIHAKGRIEKTPLHYAADENETSVAQLLLDRGADVNAEDDSRETPLHWAIQVFPPVQTTHTVQLLLDRGANVNATNASNQTPLDLALHRETSSKLFADLLRSRGCVVAVSL
eukprot:GDKI01017657.1.p1 GENE.GDKI01017657.1~~GDKI01017657.1.p1  ORF type:complete len:212 (-),score=31.57 GDKI01017657.1:36-671(-)